MEETTAILQVEESSAIEQISWSEDGRLLAAITSDGSVHLYLGKLPMLSASFNSCAAILTSLNQITVFYCHLDKVSFS